MKKVDELIEAHFSLKEPLLDNAGQVEKAVKCLVECFRSNGKVLIFGNGGSAADAQHFAAELVGRYKKNRRGLPAIALTTDSSVLTSVANDYNFDNVFVRQVEAMAKPGDVVFAITTSGNSINVLNAMEKAKQMKAKTIALNGKGGGLLKGKPDIEILIDSDETPRVQEAHILCIHIICELVEELLFPDDRPN
jgi:D-sedoheptulose 7-phosphate isomerase